MTETNHLPEDVDFNLDTLEREKTYKPFRPVINGRVVNMTDPAELDWKVLLDIEDPSQFLRHAIAEDDKAFLREQHIPGWKFGKLIDAYVKHYGLDEQRGNGKSII